MPPQGQTGNTQYASQKKAAQALLDAITEEVDVVKGEGGGTDTRTTRLLKLAQAYALVVHGPTTKD